MSASSQRLAARLSWGARWIGAKHDVSATSWGVGGGARIRRHDLQAGEPTHGAAGHRVAPRQVRHAAAPPLSRGIDAVAWPGTAGASAEPLAAYMKTIERWMKQRPRPTAANEIGRSLF